MDDPTRHLIQAIHDSPPRAVLAAAGAGSRALADLLGVPGASRTLLEALIPYAADSFDEFLGLRPEQYVSEETGRPNCPTTTATNFPARPSLAAAGTWIAGMRPSR